MPDMGSAISTGVGLIGQNKQRKAADRAADEARRQADLAYKRSLPWDVQGLLGGAEFDEEGRKLDLTLTDEWQSQYEQQLADAKRQKGFISDIEADPMAAGQKFYEMQKALYAPEQEADRLALENRLLGQGMLGSSGGASRTEALHKAQAAQDLQAQYAGLDKAQSMIDTYRGRQTGSLGTAESIAQMPQKYAQTGRGIGTGMSSIAAQAGQMGSDAAQAQGQTTANLWGGLSSQFGWNPYDDDNRLNLGQKIGGMFGPKTSAVPTKFSGFSREV